MPEPTLRTIYFNRRMVALAGVGFASGLPYLLSGDTLSAWLSDMQVDVKTIGLFSLVTIPYTWKFLGAPFLDRYLPPGLVSLGRRRGWLLVLQMTVIVVLAAIANVDPSQSATLHTLAILMFALATASAAQDVVADAYRADVLEKGELGAGAAVFVTGYRVAMIIAGAGVMTLASKIGWQLAYAAMAVLMLGCEIVTLLAPPTTAADAIRPATFTAAVVRPIEQFIRARGWAVLAMLAFVVLFKLPDALGNRMTMPLLIKEMEFTPRDVGIVRQAVGLAVTIAGALTGGMLVARLGIKRSLVLFGILQAASNAGFWLLASTSKSLALMVGVIVVESFCAGLVAAGFTAFLMSCCRKRYSATQFALLTSLMALTAAVAGAVTGYLVEAWGYASFFAFTIVAGLPGMLLIPFLRVSRRVEIVRE